jgi:hypothetical protein
VESKPVLKDPQAFEEVFAEAKRAHINKERQDILNGFPTNQIVSLKKSPNLKTTPKRQLLGEASLPKSPCLLFEPLFLWLRLPGLFVSHIIMMTILSIARIPMIF